MRYSLQNKGRIALLMVVLISGCLMTGCRSVYKGLQPATGDAACIRQFKPQYVNTLYSTQVDILKHHLSGLLFFKQMPDSSLRVVFASEMGLKFFDFAFTPDGGFVKHYMMPKMDKQVIVTTLRNDFELVLQRAALDNAKVLQDSMYRYVAIPTPKGNNYYITDTGCTRLERIEKSSKRKPVVKVWLRDYQQGVPDTILIQHQNFKFNISLQQVQK
ncbi:hypothetical protein F0L74_18290 [Chitinophaga agrisoli]|uniref:Outer membrane lipoprotein-sorting protein n=1 Tax=Chitinophaga agrisoli TaxID=2607653 RepID=A0A5B2VSJ2_9BACT|nr:hypothetical protein [Chitinophaga agrisoli]KAA2241814.1 hypothetical protein F0L74_18290 [Chitinophaga agrisoli]